MLPLAAAMSLAGCAGAPTHADSASVPMSSILQSRHAGDDDLLTAGLGAAGLSSPIPPPFADPAHPSAAELRRRAIWSNWRGIADLAPGSGYGTLYGAIAPVPGREFHALMKIPGATHPHRVLLQVPDSFDPAKPCIVVTASSGSRGVYGAIALAGSWGLAHGCAVAYTDKGTGTGYVEVGASDAVGLDGVRRSDGEEVEFSASATTPPVANAAAPPIATKHANSGDNPEADWGRHVQQAVEFARHVLGREFPANHFDGKATRVIAVGVSNAGGAVLRAAELPGDWLDAVVAVSPNIQSGAGGRPIYDYGTEAALYLPCALDVPIFDDAPLARPGGKHSPGAALRCASLQSAGLLPAGTPEAAARAALDHLHAQGWTDAAIGAGALDIAFDLWRSIAVTYASSYTRSAADAMPCGFSFHAVDAAGAPRAPTGAERAAWWSDASGIPPGAGVSVVDPSLSGSDPTFKGLQCLRALWSDPASPQHDALHAGIEATRAALPRAGLPVLVIHGESDGLVVEAFTSAPYVSWAKSADRDVRYWRVDNAQHFDAFLGLPAMAASYVPMLAYAYHGLDRVWAHLETGAPMPGDAQIATTPRKLVGGALVPLRSEDLGIMP